MISESRGASYTRGLRDNLPGPQLRRLLPTLLVLYVPLGCTLAGMSLYAAFPGNHIETLTRDPLALVEAELLKFHLAPDKSIHTFALLHLPLYTGLVSTLGMILWTASATLTCFAAARSWKEAKAPFRPAFLAAFSILTLALLADDLWMLHERVLSRVFAFPEIFLLAVYALSFLLLCAFFLNEVLRSDYLLLLAALLCFALSLSADALPLHRAQLLEDCAKFTGIVHWAGYHWRLAGEQLRPRKN